MNEQDIILLNDYFNGLLSPEQAESVRSRAAAGGEFGQEFELRQHMEEFPRRDARRKVLADQLAATGADFFKETEAAGSPNLTAKVNWRRWMAVAASLLLVGAAVWFMQQSEPSYSRYAQHTPLSLTVRGATDEAASKAESDFNAHNYAGALAALDQLLAVQPDLLTAQLYKGICLIELDRGAEARSVLTPVAEGASALRAEAIWYVALSYLKEKDNNNCRASLQRLREGDDHFEQAQALLKKLR